MQFAGYREVRSEVTPNEPLFAVNVVETVPIRLSSAGIDGGNGNFNYEIRAGWLMGMITASKLWVPCKRTVTSGTGSSSVNADATEVTVDNAAAFKLGDTITVGSSTGLTVTAIDYDNNIITVDDAIPVTNDAVVVAEDGSQTCRGILMHMVKLKDADNINAINAPGALLIRGTVNPNYLFGDVAAIRADANAKLQHIAFSDDYGL